MKLLAGKLNICLNVYEVCAAHSLPSRARVPPIIVWLNNYDRRHELLVEVRRRKLNNSDLGLSGQLPVFVNEHLARETKELLVERRVE